MLISLARLPAESCTAAVPSFFCYLFYSVFRLVILLLLLLRLSSHFHSIRIYVFIWQLLDCVVLREHKKVEKVRRTFFPSPKYYNPLDLSFSQLFVTIHYSTIIWMRKSHFFPSAKVISAFFSLARLLWRKSTNRFMIVYRIWNFPIY